MKLRPEEFLAGVEANTPKPQYVFDDPDKLVALLNGLVHVVSVGKEVQFAFPNPGGGYTFRRRKDADMKLAQYRLVTIERKKDKNGKKKDVEKIIPAFPYWLTHPDRQEYDGVEFCPDLTKADPKKLNLYGGYAIQPATGEYPLFHEHLLLNVCLGDGTLLRFLMAIFAQMFQDPNYKLGIAIVLIGDTGVGKSKISEWLGNILGSAHSPVIDKTSHLTGQFRAQLEYALLMRLEEGNKPVSDEDVSTLKHVITSPDLLIEKKGMDAYSAPNYLRLIITTNSEHPIPAIVGERRFFVLKVGKGRQKDRAFFRAVDDEMRQGGAAAFLHDLLNYDYSQVDFAQIPMTVGLQEQIRFGFSAEVKWLESVLSDGAFPFKDCRTGDTYEWHGDETLEISKALVVESFRDFVSQRSTPTSQQVGTFLANHIPALEETRRKSRLGRLRYWVFPPLDVLRAQFIEAHPGYVFPQSATDGPEEQAANDDDADFGHRFRR